MGRQKKIEAKRDKFFGLRTVALGSKVVGTLRTQYYDEGSSKTDYIKGCFSPENDTLLRYPLHIDWFFSILVPLLYTHQFIVLLEPYAEALATYVVALLKPFKRVRSLSALPPSHLNPPAPNVALVLSSEAVLLGDNQGAYTVNFFAAFRSPGGDDRTIFRFLSALLPWAQAQIHDDAMRLWMLAHVDLVCTFFSRGWRGLADSPLLRPDTVELIAELGWPVHLLDAIDPTS